MEILSIIGLIILVLIVWAILKFVLRLAGRVIGCTLTAIFVIGIVAIIIWVF